MKAVLVLVAVLAIGCSSAGTSNAGAGEMALGGGRCAAAPGDSIYTSFTLAYRDCAVTVKAVRLPTTARLDFTPPREAREACFSAELEYVVGLDGVIERSTARVIRTNSQELANAMMTYLGNVRFEPATLNGVRVRQIVTDRQKVVSQVIVMPAGQRPSPGSKPSSRPTTC